MNYKSVTIISIIVAAIFVLPLFSFAEDETVPGVPFQKLQEQIDDLQEQIDAVQTGPIKAYVGKQMMNFPPLGPDEIASVITLELPIGKYINTITISAAYFGGEGGTFSASDPGHLSCWFVDDENNEITGHLIAGNIIGVDTIALTMELELWEKTTAILKCQNVELWTSADMAICQAIWTAIKVGELDNQPPLPPE